MIKRLITAYNCAKETQRTLDRIWQPSSMWQNFLLYRLPLIEALEKQDEATVEKLLATLFRNGSSAYTSYLRYWLALEQNDQAGLDDMKKILAHQVSTWKSYLYEDAELEDLVLPSIGSPFGMLVNGVKIMPGVATHHYHAQKVHALVADTDIPTVIEIGGGVGLFAYFLTRNHDIHYIDYDLPEISITCQYYLMKAFPNKKFLLYGEEPTEDNYDYILMPHFELPNLSDDSADVFVNFHSLSEMNLDTVKEYMRHISRATKGYFYHENSIYPIVPLGSIGELHEIVANQFDVPTDRFTLLNTMANIWAENVYREFLYKRRETVHFVLPATGD